MRIKISVFVLASLVVILSALATLAQADKQKENVLAINGPYLGQKPPGTTPEIFAPSVISSIYEVQNCLTISPDETEIYWGRYYQKEKINKILHVHYKNEKWSTPLIVSFSGSNNYNDDAPFLSPDGLKLYFNSRRPLSEKDTSRKERIWVVEKSDSVWSDPAPISESVNAMDIHMQFSLSENGTIYFKSRKGESFGNSDIFCAECLNGEFLECVNLGKSVNSESNEMTPFISPDESVLLFARNRNPDGLGLADLYICFKTSNGEWTEAKNMGAVINSEYNETCPVISPGGKYIFFNSDRSGKFEIYWIDAKIIEGLKPKGLKNQLSLQKMKKYPLNILHSIF